MHMPKPSFEKKIELLAPAGDLSRAKTAILYGADAIYLGGMNYSLRSRASNFTMEDIREVCQFAREHGARVHVTTNIIPHDEDFDGVGDYFKALQDYGVTAVITASPAYMQIARQCAPELEIHCSTQLSITNTLTAKYLSEMLHVDRVVLARECTLPEVQEITKHCPVETEAFIHGGMCVNYSGRCTLSNRMTLRDANRGGCAQSCRWQYHLYENDKELSDAQSMFTMGSKDLMSASVVKDLILAGVSSLKIEGRMKSSFYVATVVNAYRRALNGENIELLEKELEKASHRTYTTGFFLDEKQRQYYPSSRAVEQSKFIAKVLDWKDGVVTVEQRNKFVEGQTLEILSVGESLCKTFTADDIRDLEGNKVDVANIVQQHLTFKCPHRVFAGDILRLPVVAEN